jgi:hypothetical protein
MPEHTLQPQVAVGATAATLCNWLARGNQQYATGAGVSAMTRCAP